MQNSPRANGRQMNGKSPTAILPAPHVVEDIAAAAERVPSVDPASAALRSILIGAVLVGGLTWLARAVLRRGKKS